MPESNRLMTQFFDSYLYVLKYLNDFVAEPASHYHITFDTFIIMREIDESQQDILLMDLARKHQVSRSAISRQISTLLKYHYVYQVADPHDRRRKSLKLTASGHMVETKLLNETEHHFNHWVQVFGKERVESILSFTKEFDEKIIKTDHH